MATSTITTGVPAQLIPTFQSTIGGVLATCCDARALHEFLENKRQFSDWIKGRIEHYGFEAGSDFECVSQKCETQRTDGQLGVTTRTDYHLTLDMAKELSMVENNEQGREARRYFLTCEKLAHAPATLKPTLTRRTHAAQISKASTMFPELIKTAASMGVNNVMAVEAANRVTKMTTGIDLLGIMGIDLCDIPFKQGDTLPMQMSLIQHVPAISAPLRELINMILADKKKGQLLHASLLQFGRDPDDAAYVARQALDLGYITSHYGVCHGILGTYYTLTEAGAAA